ncbi:DUF2917 domain-containing protein [Ramlibacter sp. PS3R-8]|uniref:DUF2917 domain-containing protein n=1 Tax=Ramlibacter sp. PS3R-8 TaxID=3133437 RepID=UPI00309B3A80
MNLTTTHALPARQLFSVADASAVRIVCTAGSLWLTLDHDQHDVVLEAGDAYETGDRRRALVYAFEPSTFELVPQPQPSMRRKLAKNSSDCSRSPSVWAATRAASSV